MNIHICWRKDDTGREKKKHQPNGNWIFLVIFCTANCISSTGLDNWLYALHTGRLTSIRHHSLSAAAASYGSILICKELCSSFPWHKKSKRVKEEKGFVVERMVWDAEGCVLTVRCCSSELVYSSYRLKGGRRDVGETAMETKSAHKDNEIQGYISMQRNNNMKQHNVKYGLLVVTTDICL